MTASFHYIRTRWGLALLMVAICAISAIQTITFTAIFSNEDVISIPLDVGTVVAQPRASAANAKEATILTNINDLQVTTAGCPIPDLSIALSCLRRTTPDLKVSYPDDAKEHFLEVHQALHRWTNKSKPHCHARFCGPWIENRWIDHFYNLTETMCLGESFGPFVPLFIPWVDLWVNRPQKFKYPKGFIEALLTVLRPDVPYITVSQNDQGLPGNKEMPVMKNILVLSAGGYGHVPIPLLKQEEGAVQPIPHPRQWLISYVGSLSHAPSKMRQRMHDYFIQSNASYTQYYSSKADSWRSIMANSYASLAPRGFGRTSYHIMETLQMGLIPIHVYLDVPWVPYLKIFRTLGFITTVEELPKLFQTLNQTMTLDDLREREVRIASYRNSHFSVSGLLNQIKLFLKGLGDLECVPLPKLVRGDLLTSQ